jgi:hypothetical protein
MFQMPTDPEPKQYLQPPLPQPQKPKRRFRWEIIAVILVVVGYFWFVRGIEPSFTFERLMRYIGIRHELRYIRLVCLGIVCVAIVLAVKIFRKKKD